MHRSQFESLLAACDGNLLGKCFKDGKLRLDIREDFYGTVQVDEGTFRNMLAACTIANLCGKDVVGIAIESGLIDGKNVLVIGGVPHAQFACMR